MMTSQTACTRLWRQNKALGRFLGQYDVTEWCRNFMTSSLLHLIIMIINLIMFMLTAAVFQPYGPTECLEYNENSQNNQGTCQRGHLCKVVSGVQGTFKQSRPETTKCHYLISQNCQLPPTIYLLISDSDLSCYNPIFIMHFKIWHELEVQTID